MLDVNVCRDFIDFPSLSILLHFLPVRFIVTLNWLLSELPWTFQSCLWLHTIIVCSIIDLDLLEVAQLAVFLQH